MAAETWPSSAPPPAGVWRPPGRLAILRQRLPAANFVDSWILRVLSFLGARQLRVIYGLDNVDPALDPFILAANHSIKREGLLLPAMIVFARGGKWIRFFADWNFLMIPVVGWVMRRSGAVVITRKSARPQFLNRLKRFYSDPVPAAERARARLRAGESVGVFPEGTVNRNPRRLLPGRVGTARLSLETGLPVVPVGVRFPDADPDEPLGERAAMEIHIGAPMRPPAALGDKPPIAAARAWHGTIMKEIARLSGKAWGRQTRGG